MNNPELQLAKDFVRHTGNHIFLTGKAGTGKTTFLHGLKEYSPKRMIITAPTGVAAINAGGVTLHSFFQLSFGPNVPGSDTQRQTEQRRFNKEKISIIRSLDLLVIDEISMVRADVLDGVDAVLRRYKHHHLPFGGVQLLMIGDLHQLSPVVKDDEWQLLKNYYNTQYFFSSNALQQSEMVSIELKHIYRQSDADFIQLLNRVRDNRLDGDTLKTLNSRYIPEFNADENQDYITLTTHNRSATHINDKHLQTLTTKSHSFQANIQGDYPAFSFPTAEKLILKKGAQVMFVRNDNSTDKQYFNGKIGRITDISQQSITVKCPNDDNDILVEPVTWENIKYTVDATTREITEEVIGRFTQYPLRLAWAITIHKSQGLTFERAIIDASAAFSHGQVYVALSRCKTFEGMVLSSPISPRAIKTDTAIAKFVSHASQTPPTQEQLNIAKIHYQQKVLLDCFNYQSLASSLEKFTRLLLENHAYIQATGIDTIETLKQQVFEEIITVSNKFEKQLQSLFKHEQAPEEDDAIQDRAQKATRYFNEKLQAGLMVWVSAFNLDTDNKDIKQQISTAFDLLRYNLAIKVASLHSCRTGFTASEYIEAIARAEADFSKAAPTKPQASDINAADIEHPELFNALKSWRIDQAEKEQVEQYRVLHLRILMQIAIELPNTLEALLPIKGIGNHTAEKYGSPLINIVTDYCRQHNIEPRPTIPQSEPEKPPKKDTKKVSFELYQQGKSIIDIAEARELVASTIEKHLSYYVKSGQIAITELVTQEKIAIIKQAIDEKGNESLKTLKEHLGDTFSYSEIQMVCESQRATNDALHEPMLP